MVGTTGTFVKSEFTKARNFVLAGYVSEFFEDRPVNFVTLDGPTLETMKCMTKNGLVGEGCVIEKDWGTHRAQEMVRATGGMEHVNLLYGTFTETLPSGPFDVGYLDLCGCIDRGAIRAMMRAVNRDRCIIAVTICRRGVRGQLKDLHTMLRDPPSGMVVDWTLEMRKPASTMVTVFVGYVCGGDDGHDDTGVAERVKLGRRR